MQCSLTAWSGSSFPPLSSPRGGGRARSVYDTSNQKSSRPAFLSWPSLPWGHDYKHNKLRRRRTIPILKKELKYRKSDGPPPKQVYDHEEDPNPMPPFVDQLPPGPFFDYERSGNVTALVDQSARLNCRVNQIGNRTVRFLSASINNINLFKH